MRDARCSLPLRARRRRGRCSRARRAPMPPQAVSATDRQPVVPARAGHGLRLHAASRTASRRATSSRSRTRRGRSTASRCVVVDDRLYLQGRLERADDGLVRPGRAAATSGTSARTRPSSTRTASVTSTRGHLAGGRRRRPARHLHAGPPARRPVRPAGVLQGPRRGPLPGAEPVSAGRSVTCPGTRC